MKQIRIDRIGNIGYGMSVGEDTFLSQSFQPAAACYKSNGSILVEALFFDESLIRKVMFVPTVQQMTIVTLRLVTDTILCMVTDTCHRPHIMHCPYYGFARL